MSYRRVIPRDLFNEANLLKCLGQIYLNLENLKDRCNADLSDTRDRDPFWIYQNENDGSIFVQNVTLNISGARYWPYRPLNSRDPYPLYIDTGNDETISVFNDDGSFTDEMLEFLGASK